MSKYSMRPLLLALACGFALGVSACGSGSSSADGDSNAADGDSTLDRESESATDGDADSAESDSDSGPDAMYAALAATDGPTVNNRLGVASHMSQDVEDDADRNHELAAYKELNSTGGSIQIRDGMTWGHLEPTRGEWSWDGFDTWAELARQNGVTLVGPLYYTANWSITDDKTSTLDPADFAEYARQVATRYCSTIKRYEIWNEENLDRFWEPDPDADHYGLILKAAYTAIKGACPDAEVSIGGLCSMSVTTLTDERWDFLDKLYAAHPDICQYFDLVALHPYTYLQLYSPERDYDLGGIALQSQAIATQIARDKLARMGCPDRKLWFTEYGWPSYDLDEAAQARFLARSALLALRDDIRGIFWYTFYDTEPDPTSSRPHEQHFGLYEWPQADHSNYTPKPAFNAFKGMWTVLGASRFAGDLSATLKLPNDVYVYAFLDDKQALTLALWDGREDPDGSYGDGQSSDPNTTYALTLPLPSWATTVVRYDQDGTKQEEATAQGSLALTLTSTVQYLAIRR